MDHVSPASSDYALPNLPTLPIKIKKGAAQVQYENVNCSIKALIVMHQGLFDNANDALFDHAKPPWKIIKTSLYQLHTNDFKAQVLR